MKKLSIADLIALGKYCDKNIDRNKSLDDDSISMLFDISEACNKEINKRIEILYTSTEYNMKALKSEFDSKLTKLKIKRKFINNLKARSSTYDVYIELLNTKKLWEDFISASFTWGGTPEGHEFWYNISKK